MPFVRPTLQQIVTRVESDLQTRLTGATSVLRRSVIAVIARVLAGAVHLLYGYLDYQSKQLFISTADSEGLDRKAQELGLSRNAAIKATGTATATGLIGSVIADGTEVQSEEGVIYLVDGAVTFTATSATVSLDAKEAGADGNLETGDAVTFLSPIIGIDSEMTVVSMSGGTDEELDDDLRIRLLARRAQPPHGGSEQDYIHWAKEVSGVTRAWVIQSYQGAGTLALAFVRDGDTDIFPDATERLVVYNYIISHTDPLTGETIGIPVTATPGFQVLAMTPKSCDFSIKIYPNTSDIQTAAETEIEDALDEFGGPNETVYLSQIQEALGRVPNLEYFSITSPVVDMTATATELHRLGDITWSAY